MPLHRKLLFALLTTLLVLGVLEGAAWLAEPHLKPTTTVLPSPRASECAECLPGVVATRNAAPIRLVWSDRTRTWMALDPHHPQRPEVPELRGEAPTEPKPEDQVRWMTLGDSSVWGHRVAVDAVFSTIAAKMVSQSTGRDVRSFIGAQPGHTVRHSLRTLAALAPVVRPDVVLVGNLWSDLFHPRSPSVMVAKGPDHPSALYRVMLQGLAPLLKPEVVSWIDPETGRGMPADGLSATTPLPQYKDQLRQITREIRRHGAQPAFLLLPAPMDLQSVPPFVQDYRDAMRAAAKEANAPIIDGPAWFLGHGADQSWFQDSVHPGDVGHAALGEAMAATVQSQPEKWGL